MADPDEGVAADGTIRTGAQRDRVPALFEPVLTDAVACLGDASASLYVYGSVANGTARPGLSDVDLLSIGLPDAVSCEQRLSAQYADRCRAVEVVAATTRPIRLASGISCGRSSPTSPPSFAGCSSGPAGSSTSHATKLSTHSQPMELSRRSSIASTA